MLGTLLIASAGLVILAMIAGFTLYLTAPLDADWLPDTGELLPDEFNPSSRPDRLVLFDPVTGGPVEDGGPAFFIHESEGASGGCPAAPLDNSRRGRLH